MTLPRPPPAGVVDAMPAQSRRAAGRRGPGACCVRRQPEDPARVDRLGTREPPAVRLKPALVQVEDLREPAAVAESRGRDGKEGLGATVLRWRNDVELDPCGWRGGCV